MGCLQHTLHTLFTLAGALHAVVVLNNNITVVQSECHSYYETSAYMLDQFSGFLAAQMPG